MTDFATDQLRAVATHPAFAEMQREPDDGTPSGSSGKLTPRMKRKIELAIEAGSASPIEMVPG